MVVTKNECNLRFKKEGKTNKNGNNCSTKDLVVTAADIFKAKTIKKGTQTLFFINGSGAATIDSPALRVCTVAKNDHQGTFH